MPERRDCLQTTSFAFLLVHPSQLQESVAARSVGRGNLGSSCASAVRGEAESGGAAAAAAAAVSEERVKKMDGLSPGG